MQRKEQALIAELSQEGDEDAEAAGDEKREEQARIKAL